MLIQTLAILMMLRRYLLFSIMTFRYFYKIWFGLGEDKLLYLLIVFLNSFLEKDSYIIVGLNYCGNY